MEEIYLAHTAYFDRYFNCEAMRVLPGEYYVSKDNRLMMVLLGSCIATCIWDSQRGIGGVNHFMLPGKPLSAADTSTYYGHEAMRVLIEYIIQCGGKRENLVAKVFGGAQIIGSQSTLDIGAHNCAFIVNYLKNESIPIVASDLGDKYARKVCFFPQTGRVMVRKMIANHHKFDRHLFNR